MNTPLSLTIIQSLLVKPIHLELFDTIDSTNDYLLTQKHLTDAICLAEHQTKGKGRLGREWHSPHSENIYLSYRCHLSKPMGEIGHLSMQVAEVICHMLNDYGIKEGLTIKWPNDILYNSKKLAGILIEVQPGAENTAYAVIGIGLNVNMLSADDTHIPQPWTSMRTITGQQFDRNQLAARIINTILVPPKKY